MQFIRKFFHYIFPAAFLLPALLLFFSPDVRAAADKKKFTVVIDAGHGGSDFGAIENEVNEKDVNLAVALKLADLIKKKLKDTEVVLTRSKDEFISLQKRADIANAAKGDLFISIHCNSVDKKNKNRANVLGATTYVLGHHKDADNLAVAQRENAVIELDADDSSHYSQFDPSQDESFIIFNMSQKKNFQNSIRFAADVQKEMSAAGRYSRGVQQAGFWVLWSTAMPAVLVELDFICNPEQARFLDSATGQDKLAGAVFNAVKSYEAYYRKNLGSMALDVQVEEDEPEAPSFAPEASEVAELPKSESKKKTSSRKESAKAAPADASNHRRRPKGAKAEASAGIETAVMALPEENKAVVAVKDSPKAEKPAKTEKATKADKKSKGVTAQKPARREGKRKATRQSVHIVYRILLFTSGEELAADAREFKGLSPVTAIYENNMYKYTYGESADKNEMEAGLAEVKDLFPEAYVIRIIN